MIRLIHVADVHLGASYAGFGEAAAARAEAVLDAFRTLPDVCEAERAHAVVVAGDLFDGARPSPTVVAVATETIRRVVESGRPVFIVPGNHDSVTLNPNPYRDAIGGATIFRDPVFGQPHSVETPDGALHVYGVAYDPAREPAPLKTFRRQDSPGVHVVLMHGSVPDSPTWELSPNTLRLDPAALARLDADYIALGDYHRFRGPDRFSGAPACYAGSFAAIKVDEVGPRGWVVAELAPGSSPVVRHEPSGVPPVVDLGAVSVDDLERDAEVADAVADRVTQDAILRVRLVGTPAFPLDVEVVSALLQERFGHADVTDLSRFYTSRRLDEIAARDTVAGHAVRLARRRIDDATDDAERETLEHALRVALTALGIG